MRAATEGHLPPVMPQGNLVEVLDREVRKGLPGELMVESSSSRQRRPPCKKSKEMSDEAADAAALTYLLTANGPVSHKMVLDPLANTGLIYTIQFWNRKIRYGLITYSQPELTSPIIKKL